MTFVIGISIKRGDFGFRLGSFCKKTGAYTQYVRIFLQKLTPHKGKSALLILALPGCFSPNNQGEPKLSAEAQRGRTIYQTQCITCHNTDPHKPGSIGPDLFGSPRELIEARVLRAEYPPGYTPKRQTHAMAPLPHLKNEIDALTRFLNE